MILLGQAVAATLFALARVCPRCSKRRVPPLTQQQGSVVCRFCGSMVPPKKTEATRVFTCK